MGKYWLQIIIIVSCRQHRYPWPSLATSPYRSSPLAGLQGYIPYPHIAAVCMFELVVLLLAGHMWGTIGVHHLWPRPCVSSSVPACLVRLTWIVGRLARTYIQQLSADTGCSPEDQPEEMDDREGWQERVRNIRTDSTTWWWWWW